MIEGGLQNSVEGQAAVHQKDPGIVGQMFLAGVQGRVLSGAVGPRSKVQCV